MGECETLLAHVVARFGGTENAATEALAYILDRSAEAREALDDVVRSGVENVPSVVRVRTQVMREGVVPDLVGEDEAGEKRVLVEVKFWADLTPAQPNAYLDLLPDDGPAVLLFLVPDERVGMLWPSLRKRAESAGRKLSEVDAERKSMCVCDSGRHLMVTGWTGLLDRVATRAREAGEHHIEADVRQLRGLADYAVRGGGREADRDSWLRGIVDSATGRGVDAGWLSTKGLRRTPMWHGYGRYVQLRSGVPPWFGIHRDRYKANGETPLWLWFGKPAENKAGRINQAQFDALRHHCRLQDANGWVPLPLPVALGPDVESSEVPDVETSEVVDAVVAQLERISEVIDNAR